MMCANFQQTYPETLMENQLFIRFTEAEDLRRSTEPRGHLPPHQQEPVFIPFRSANKPPQWMDYVLLWCREVEGLVY